MKSYKFNTLYFIDDSKIFRETWNLLSKGWTCVCFASVEEFLVFLGNDAHEKLNHAIVVTDMRFSKESKFDGFDTARLVSGISKNTPIFLATTGIVGQADVFTDVIDKNPRVGIEQIISCLEL